MKSVSLQDLKKSLSALVAEAAAGARIVITRHKRPVAVLTPADRDKVHEGSRFGRGELEPLFQNATNGAYLSVLAEDRADDE